MLQQDCGWILPAGGHDMAGLHQAWSTQSSGKIYSNLEMRNARYNLISRIKEEKGFFLAVLRSRHFFGRLRLLMAKVPEPTPAPTYLGRLQAKRGGSSSIH